MLYYFCLKKATFKDLNYILTLQRNNFSILNIKLLGKIKSNIFSLPYLEKVKFILKIFIMYINSNILFQKHIF